VLTVCARFPSWPIGWNTEKIALLYTRKADRKWRATPPLCGFLANFENRNVRTLGPVREPDEIPQPNQGDIFGMVPRRGLEPPRLLTTGT
jgi:hypothetical protein